MFPKRVKLFIPWAKAMVAGATVDKPTYGKSASRHNSGTNRKPKRKRRRRRKKKKDA